MSVVQPSDLNDAVGDFRLPNSLQPTHYDLTICTDLISLVYAGRVRISLNIEYETSTVMFNMAEILLQYASLFSESLGETLQPSSQVFDAAGERVVLNFGKPLPAKSKALLDLRFKCVLNASLQGYFRSSWNHDGKTMYYALTQFEPIAARRAFPCWDEPALKATFDVTMISRVGGINLSNMPILSEQPYLPEEGGLIFETSENLGVVGEWKITRFETSPIMSTYLLAWANGPFDFIEESYTSPLSNRSRPLRIYTTPDALHQAKYVLDVTTQVMPIYEQLFDIDYPLPKLDTLIVDDFDVDAMENWGLIIGRKSAFLLDPELADMVAKKRVATTQSHEIAHMWFGNITTMAWWDNLYLNEGFATIMGEVLMIDRILPEWKVDSEFINIFLNDALGLDAKPSSHPIEADCPDASQTLQVFDALSYAKAASVLRMLAKYVGEQRFLEGVTLYLKKRLYGNSVSRDLWECVSEATGFDIARLMDNWVTKTGFPVITVTETAQGIHVRQDRFLEEGPNTEKQDQIIWSIPLNILSVNSDGQSELDSNIILDGRESDFCLNTKTPFKLNAGTTGVYRVLYTPDRLLDIAHVAAKDENIFSLDDRMGLVHDSMALGMAGYSQLSTALSVIDILRQENEYLVWASISANLSKLISIFWEHSQIIDHLNTFRRNLYDPLVRRLGFEYLKDEPVGITLLRTNVIEQAAAAGHARAVEELRELFAECTRRKDYSRIPADLTKVTYITAVRHGGRLEYEAVKWILKKPKTPTSGISAMHAMCAVEDPILIQETLEFLLIDARDQDVIYFFEGLQANHKTRRTLLQFFRENYDLIYERFKNNFSLKYLIECSHNALTRIEDYHDCHHYFQDKDISKYILALSQSLDSIKAKAACVERSQNDILDWLQARSSSYAI